MKKCLWPLLAVLFLGGVLNAQTENQSPYRDFPVMLSLQFHALSMPFRNIGAAFSNVGIGLGTEFSYHNNRRAVQQIQLVWYRNRKVGNGLLWYTQACWRPALFSGLHGELKGGVGYLLSFHPSPSFKPSGENWLPVGRKGKGMVTIPIGIGLSYHDPQPRAYWAPFLNYQFLPLLGYSQSVPVVPENLWQIGVGGFR